MCSSATRGGCCSVPPVSNGQSSTPLWIPSNRKGAPVNRSSQPHVAPTGALWGFPIRRKSCGRLSPSEVELCGCHSPSPPQYQRPAPGCVRGITTTFWLGLCGICGIASVYSHISNSPASFGTACRPAFTLLTITMARFSSLRRHWAMARPALRPQRRDHSRCT